jgi:hypothetical protein
VRFFGRIGAQPSSEPEKTRPGIAITTLDWAGADDPSTLTAKELSPSTLGDRETEIDWIESDGRLRTDEEIIEELLPELGFRRRGARIEGVLKSVLERHRNRARTGS